MINFRNAFVALLCCFFLFSNLQAQSGRIPVKGKNGMVVSSHYLASEVGKDILKKGGNAVDAAVATAFALSVALPSAGNIGGGGFLVYYGADGEKTTFNFREKAPLKATPEMYLDENNHIKDHSNHDGILAVGVPGTVAGLYQAHQKQGNLSWEQLVQPAIDLAENGFEIGEDLADFSDWVYENRQKYPSTAAIFLKFDSQPFDPGDVLKQPELAGTLRRIRDQGAEGFYSGKTAKLLHQFMKKNDGIITRKDLKRYRAEELAPVTGSYRNYEIVGMPPPSSGGVAVIEMLNILEGIPLKKYGQNSAQSLHLLTEAMRRAYADRALFLGDANFNPEMPLEKLTSKDYAGKLRESIEMKKASFSDSANFNKEHLAYESPETTHLSVVDQEGNAVSLTYTLEQSFGSKIVVEGAGFLLNNEMGDFNPIPGYTNSKGLIGTKPNLIAPEKRMLSSMSPTIVAKNGQPVIVIGSPGGRTIINTVLEVIVNMIDFDLDIAKAIESPRFHHQWLPDVTYFESWGFSPDTMELYEAMGHEIKTRSSQGRVMGIYIDTENEELQGAADSRSPNGRAVGY